MSEPRVKFKRADENNFPEWTEVNLADILTEYTELHEKDGKYEHVSLTKEGVVSKTDRYDRDFLVTTSDKKYRVTHYNDICYNPANLKFGVICRNSHGDAIFSPIYITFRISDGYIPEFVEMLVTNGAFIQRALKYQQGTVYERMAVSPEDLLSLKVHVPCFEEQKKIADFLSLIDEAVITSNEEIANLETQKKYSLQRIFSQTVRFRRAGGESYPTWKSIRFGDVFTFKNGINASRGAFRSGGIKCIGVSDVYKCMPIWADNVNGTVALPEKDLNRYAVEYGDILFQRSSETQADIGHASVYVDDKKAVFNGFVICAKPESLFYDPLFMHYAMQTDDIRTQTIRLGAGAQHYNIGQDSLSSLTLFLPCLEEQHLIADFLSDFDDAITAAKRELELWKELKKGLLQQMFV